MTQQEISAINKRIDELYDIAAKKAGHVVDSSEELHKLLGDELFSEYQKVSNQLVGMTGDLIDSWFTETES